MQEDTRKPTARTPRAPRTAQPALDGTSAEMWGKSSSTTSTGRGQWLKESRFALFIHWGLYSQLAGQWQGRNHYGIAEWIMHRARIPRAEYAKVAESFDPVEFDARAWVRLAKAAGMRHIVITAKHHEGFAMFRSAASPFNIVDATPFGRDPLRELADACRAEGMRLGFYYSQTADWHEPDAVGNSWDAPVAGADFKRYLRDKVMPQIEELMTGYGPVSAVWFDTPGPITADESHLLVDLVHRLQPQCLVNSRIGNGLGDYDTLGDQEIPPLPRPGLWETIDTHNDTWGFAAHDHNWKSARELAERLVRVVSRGGTYMLNIGPDGRGRIPAASAHILADVGRWISAHESAIHGAEPTPFGALPWGECTRRGQILFLHVFHWPANGRLELPGLRSPVRQAHLVTGGTIGVTPAVTGVTLALPAAPPDTLIPVIALELDGELDASREFFVLSACRNALDAGAARLDGCELRTVSWMEKFGDWKHADCLGGWSANGGAATWEFQTTAPAVFWLNLEYTCPADDDYAEWRVRCAGTDISFPLLDTGERTARKAFGGELPRFRTYRVGLIQLPGPGTHRLVLGPTGSEGRQTRITTLTLTE